MAKPKDGPGVREHRAVLGDGDTGIASRLVPGYTMPGKGGHDHAQSACALSLGMSRAQQVKRSVSSRASAHTHGMPRTRERTAQTCYHGQ